MFLPLHYGCFLVLSHLDFFPANWAKRAKLAELEEPKELKELDEAADEAAKLANNHQFSAAGNLSQCKGQLGSQCRQQEYGQQQCALTASERDIGKMGRAKGQFWAAGFRRTSDALLTSIHLCQIIRLTRTRKQDDQT